MLMPHKVSLKVSRKVSRKVPHKVYHSSALPTLNCANQTQHMPPSNLSQPTVPLTHPKAYLKAYQVAYHKVYPKVCHKNALATLSCASQTQHMLPSSLRYNKVHHKICLKLLLEPTAMPTDSTQP